MELDSSPILRHFLKCGPHENDIDWGFHCQDPLQTEGYPEGHTIQFIPHCEDCERAGVGNPEPPMNSYDDDVVEEEPVVHLSHVLDSPDPSTIPTMPDHMRTHKMEAPRHPVLEREASEGLACSEHVSPNTSKFSLFHHTAKVETGEDRSPVEPELDYDIAIWFGFTVRVQKGYHTMHLPSSYVPTKAQMYELDNRLKRASRLSMGFVHKSAVDGIDYMHTVLGSAI